jgi:RNA polymerase sigma-70 factor (ECF subfamily)
VTAARTDSELLREARRRPEAFVTVCERHVPPLRLWLGSQTQDDEAAADLLAETLAQAWRSRRRYRDPGTGSARPWLFGIARNLLLRYWHEGAVERRARDRLRVLHLSNELTDEDVESRLAAAADQPRLREALAELSRDQRDALGLRVLAEHGYTEIGAELAVSPITARTRVHRALSALRARLEGET